MERADRSRLHDGHGDGPRGTPTVDGDFVYGLGAQGELICVDIGSGGVVWRKNLKTDLGGEMWSEWGYSESPLVDGDLVVCTPGGKSGTLAALDKKTGEVRWRSKDWTDKAAYSSVVVTVVGGVRQYVQMTGESVAGIAAEDGRLLWRFRRSSPTAPVPTPIVDGDRVYVSSGYGAGCALLRLTAKCKDVSCTEVHKNKNLVNHHGGAVLTGGCVYGYDDNKGLVCQDFQTTEVVWAQKDVDSLWDKEHNRGVFGKMSLTCADGRLYCYGEDAGTVLLVEATPKGLNVNGRFTIPEQTKVKRKSGKIWTHPVVADGKLYLRDQDLIFCYDVKESGSDRCAATVSRDAPAERGSGCARAWRVAANLGESCESRRCCSPSAVLALTTAAQAADWPQWRGPDRSGVSAETGLLKQWPKDGPELAWTFEDAGTGYGSFAVVGGRVYLARRPAA